jgi:hypothetical protein
MACGVAGGDNKAQPAYQRINSVAALAWQPVNEAASKMAKKAKISKANRSVAESRGNIEMA